MQAKLLILQSEGPTNWYSCDIIESAMREGLFASDFITLTLAKDQPLNESDLKVIGDLQKESSLYIYFLSSHIRPELIVPQLVSYRNIVYVFPIYGNMTIETERWIRLERILKRKDVIFICASQAQLDQLKVLVRGSVLLKMPYPIHSYFFNPPKEDKNLNIRIVYSGRLTAQKNILELMKVVNSVSVYNPNIELHIAGNFDERGYHFHGYLVNFEQFKTRFYEEIERSKGRIIFHGFLTQEQLSNLYDSSDYVLSMSTYHDEDFGVSVAQAMAKGLPAILSDWGGHSDFVQAGKVQFIQVMVDELNIPRPSVSQLFSLLSRLNKKTTLLEKENNQKIAHQYLSTSSYLQNMMRITRVQPISYLGQTKIFLDYAYLSRKCYVFHKDGIFGNQSLSKYLEIYSSYLNPSQRNLVLPKIFHSDLGI